MLINHKVSLLSLSLVLALLVAAFMPLAAFAQDEPPPPESPVGEPAPPEEPPAPEEQPAGEEAPAGNPPGGESDMPELLEQLPAGTDLVVMDGSGALLPLASQDAATALASGDPYFLNSGTGLVDGFTLTTCPPVVTGVCTVVPSNPIQHAVDAFSAQNGSGTITVEAGSYFGTVTVDGIANLTGLISTAGSGVTTIDGSFGVYNMANDFTFQGFTVTGAMLALNNTGVLSLTDLVVSNPSGHGIFVHDHTGDVMITNVHSDHNEGDGAFIETTGNVLFPAMIGLPIPSNTFNGNGGAGITVKATGGIHNFGTTYSDISASGNGLYGANFFSDANVALGSVVGSPLRFDKNQKHYGVKIISGNGGTWLFSISASNNLGDGAILENSNNHISISHSVFNNNRGEGLVASTKGLLDFSHVSADGNKGNGATLLSDEMYTHIHRGSFTNNGACGINNSQPLNHLSSLSSYFGGNAYGDFYGVPEGSEWIECARPNGSHSPGDPGGDANTAASKIIAVTSRFDGGQLPGVLPASSTYAGSMSVILLLDGRQIDSAPYGVPVSFTIPDGMAGKTFNVLFWTGEQWVTLSSWVSGNLVKFHVTEPGIYALVVVP